jgi:hypothetical protein
MEGAYGQHRYKLTFSVPILLAGTLNDWVAEDMNGLSSAQRAPILIEDTIRDYAARQLRSTSRSSTNG